MLKVLEEKVIERYVDCIAEKETILAQCKKEAEEIGFEKHYSEETIEKLNKFILENTRQEEVEAVEREIAFWGEFVVEVEEEVKEEEKPCVEAEKTAEIECELVEEEPAAEVVEEINTIEVID